jgi:lipid-binding SYLF domain-containing protein
MFRKTTILTRLSALALALAAARSAAAAGQAGLTRKLEAKVAASARMIDSFMNARDSEIPKDLVHDATCIAALPGVAKGAFGIGGEYGKGLVSCRLASGAWSAPVFVELSGASFGLQLGGSQTDLLLVVRNRDGAKWFVRDKTRLGADASIAAGPWGRTTGAATDATLQAGILHYSRSRGAFIGIALDGAALTQDNSDNERLFGHAILTKEVLTPAAGEPIIPTPPAARRFIDALVRHAGGSSSAVASD